MTATPDVGTQFRGDDKQAEKLVVLSNLDKSALIYETQTRKIAQKLVGHVLTPDGKPAGIDQIQAAVKVAHIQLLIDQGKAQGSLSRINRRPYRTLCINSQKLITNAIDDRFLSGEAPKKPDVSGAKPAPEAAKSP